MDRFTTATSMPPGIRELMNPFLLTNNQAKTQKQTSSTHPPSNPKPKHVIPHPPTHPPTHPLSQEPFLFLAKTPDPALINKALLYVRDNEQTSRVLVVHFLSSFSSSSAPEEAEGGGGVEEGPEADQEEREAFEASVKVIDKIYPKIMVTSHPPTHPPTLSSHSSDCCPVNCFFIHPPIHPPT